MSAAGTRCQVAAEPAGAVPASVVDGNVRMRVRVTVAVAVTRTVRVTMRTPWGRRATVPDADAGTAPAADPDLDARHQADEEGHD